MQAEKSNQFPAKIDSSLSGAQTIRDGTIQAGAVCSLRICSQRGAAASQRTLSPQKRWFARGMRKSAGACMLVHLNSALANAEVEKRSPPKKCFGFAPVPERNILFGKK